MPIEYPAGLEDMINGWKICATARLFLQVNLFWSRFSPGVVVLTTKTWASNTQKASEKLEFVSILLSQKCLLTSQQSHIVMKYGPGKGRLDPVAALFPEWMLLFRICCPK